MIKGLSLFANVGVAETYLKDVGVDIVVANELLPDRARFYEHLYPNCQMTSWLQFARHLICRLWIYFVMR